jgi:sensor histidine kinase YesM
MLKFDKILDIAFTRHRWILHVLFWTIILLWYVLFFGRQNNNYLQTLFFVGLVMPVTICTTYFLNYFLIPKFLMKDKYGLFTLYFVYTMIISIFLEMVMSIITFYLMAELKTKNMSPASFDVFFILTSLLAVVFLSMAIKLLLHWRTSKDDLQKLMLEKVENELKFLKAQLNPHFLFNTLNNLYYLATQKSDQAPAAILQLSEILDYSLYTSRALFVPLEQEWRQVENYIALESLHYEDRLDVEAKVSGNVVAYRISPMMLITLVENAFKHGVVKSKEKSWVKINVSCDKEFISISVRNSYENSLEKKGGIGMENLKNQLNLLYPDSHVLEVNTKSPGEFSLTLSLTVDK